MLKNTIMFISALCVLLCAQRVFAYGDDYDSRDNTYNSKEQLKDLEESINVIKEDVINEDEGSVDSAPIAHIDPSQVGTGNLNMANPAMVRQAIKLVNSQFKNMPDDQVAEMIRTSLEGKPLVNYISQSDKAINFAVGLIKDDKAMLYLFELTQDKKILKIALGVVIGLFILMYFLKKMFIKKDDFILLRFVKGIIFFFFSTATKLIVIYILYKDYLDPSVEVFKKRVL